MNCSKDSIVALIQVLFVKSGKLKAILVITIVFLLKISANQKKEIEIYHDIFLLFFSDWLKFSKEKQWLLL
jgi:hypothetical protein